MADLAGERCLVKPSDGFASAHLMELRVVEVCRSREYVRVECGPEPSRGWRRVADYTLIEVLEPWADNGRALAQLHGLLGTADVRAVRDMVRVLRDFAPEGMQASIDGTCPKLGRTPNGELRTASGGAEPGLAENLAGSETGAPEAKADKVAKAACTCPLITCLVHCWP